MLSRARWCACRRWWRGGVVSRAAGPFDKSLGDRGSVTCALDGWNIGAAIVFNTLCPPEFIDSRWAVSNSEEDFAFSLIIETDHEWDVKEGFSIGISIEQRILYESDVRYGTQLQKQYNYTFSPSFKLRHGIDIGSIENTVVEVRAHAGVDFVRLEVRGAWVRLNVRGPVDEDELVTDTILQEPLPEGRETAAIRKFRYLRVRYIDG